jgi:hypothetical protein
MYGFLIRDIILNDLHILPPYEILHHLTVNFGLCHTYVIWVSHRGYDLHASCLNTTSLVTGIAGKGMYGSQTSLMDIIDMVPGQVQLTDAASNGP